MKLPGWNGAGAKTKVAPLTGAWIETFQVPQRGQIDFVAPLTGAWIETRYKLQEKLPEMVAPLTGAWIETKIRVRSC